MRPVRVKLKNKMQRLDGSTESRPTNLAFDPRGLLGRRSAEPESERSAFTLTDANMRLL
jgi:hypothetical protein